MIYIDSTNKVKYIQIKFFFNNIVLFFILSLGIAVSCILFINRRNYPGYESYYWVPLIFSFLYALFPHIYRCIKNPAMLVFNLIIILKYVLLPLFLYLSGYQISRGSIPKETDISFGILLTIYELIAVMITAGCLAPKMYRNRSIKSIHIKTVTNKLIYIILVLISIVLILIVPGAINTFIPNSNIDMLSVENKSNLIDVIISFGRLTFVLLVLSFIQCKYQKKQRIIYPVLAIALVGVNMIMVSGLSRWTIVVPGICYTYLLLNIFTKYKRFVIIFFLSIVLFLTMGMSIEKSFGEDKNFDELTEEIDIEWIAGYIEAYTSGPRNTAIALKTNEYIDTNNISRLEIVFNDLFSSVAKISRYTNYDNSTPNIFNYLFYSSHISKDQIVPLVVQGFACFGFIFSPLYSIISVIMMMILERNALKPSNDLFNFYIFTYGAIWFARGITLSTTIIFSHFINTVCLFYLIQKVNSYIILKSKNR